MGLAGIAAFATLGTAAALTRAGADVVDALPSLLGALVGAVTLWAFVAGPLELDPWPWSSPTPLPATADGTGRHAGSGPGATSGPAAASGPLPAEPAGQLDPATSGPSPSTPGRSVSGPSAPGRSGPSPSTPGRSVSGPSAPGRSASGASASDRGVSGASASDRGVSGASAWGRSESGPVDPGSRRRFLSGVGTVLGVATVGGVAGRWLAGRRGVSAAREAIILPAPVSAAPPVPAGADLALPSLAGYVTSNRGFYRIDTALVVPQVDPESWRLRIHGRVRNPITLSYADLLARPMVERYVTLACVSNEVGGDLIGNARWLGVPIRELLDEVAPLDGADQVVGRSVDGWTCGTPTALLRDGRDALLAVGMNGEPLPVAHGFPARMVVPGLYGYVSACKWITELELTSFADFDAYWVPRGWSAQGPVKTQSRIDTPRPRHRPAAGPVTVAGVAWAQHRGIRRVEVRVDGGPWQEAELAPTVSVDTWVQWSWRWQATPGEHTLQVRATDSTGETQTGQRQDVAPDGATGWHTVTLTVS
ncbi:molybdopterin-dependent oxidoreductase [Micromonospora craterilacus]|uniref:molybdopterin-dependent oxidoreductase n=1 Tax=Micromonospora craterilacus TaxID=1655439 RepID=UPI003F697A6D